MASTIIKEVPQLWGQAWGLHCNKSPIAVIRAEKI